MPYNVVEIDESEATTASFRDLREEEALASAAKDGNQQALEILIRLHQRRILAVAMRFARIREDAEDIAQQSFQKAFVYLHRFEGKSSFSTWLTRIAINEALMWLRRKRASREIPVEESTTMDEAELPLDFPNSDPSPEENCLHEEQKRILAAALNELTQGMRTAVELRELGELSTEETARILGISIAAVKGRLFHARRKLRRRLKHYVRSAWTSRRDTSQAIKTRHVPEAILSTEDRSHEIAKCPHECRGYVEERISV
jgi:RNA polymerase sigma-70 factor (ECF subfamily)